MVNRTCGGIRCCGLNGHDDSSKLLLDEPEFSKPGLLLHKLDFSKSEMSLTLASACNTNCLKRVMESFNFIWLFCLVY